MTKLYTIDSRVEVPSLGIMAPISTPVRLDTREVLKLVRNGVVIYEHNPAYPKEKVRVDTHNVNNIIFEKTRKFATLEKIQKTNAKTIPIKTTTTPVIKKKDRQEEVKPKIISNDTPVSDKLKNDFEEMK